MSKIPFLEIPIKTTLEDCNFEGEISRFIEKEFQEDANGYQSEINEIVRLRKDAGKAGKKVESRNLLFRYYGQLEFLALRFPIGDTGLNLNFEWFDAFSGVSVSQSSIAFEKANIIFNNGAVCSSIAALADKSEPEGLKMAYNYFQLSAGFFQFINDNFLHPPSLDLSRDSIKCLVDLMLTQAQETFIEKCLSENKSGLLVSKLAIHVGSSYNSIVEEMANPTLQNQFHPTWIQLLKAKSKYFLALGHFHKAKHCESQAEYGEIITFLSAASKLSQEAVKLSKTFANNLESFLNFTITSPIFSSTPNSPSSPKSPKNYAITKESSIAFEETCKNFSNLISDALKTANKDNDMIYLAKVPQIESLAPLEKVCIVKAINLHEILPNGLKDAAELIGSDIFSKLVPMEVTTQSSLFTDEKDKKIRKIKELKEKVDSEMQAKLQSISFHSTLAKLKNGSRQVGGSVNTECPNSLLDSMATVQSEEAGNSSLSYQSQTIDAKAKQVEGLVHEIVTLLDQDFRDCEGMRLKYKEKWTQSGYVEQANSIKDERNRVESNMKQALRSFQQLAPKISSLSSFLNLARMPISTISSTFKSSCIPDATSPSLLDDSVAEDESLVAKDKKFIFDMDAEVSKINLVANQVGSLSAQLIEKLNSDDISSKLLLYKGKEQQIIKNELEKYRPLEEELNGEVSKAESLLDTLLLDFKSYTNASETLKIISKREGRENRVAKEWESNIESYFEVKSSLNEITSSLVNTLNVAGHLRNKAVDYINFRNSERKETIQKIELQDAESSQLALRTELSRLQVHSSMANNSLPPPNTSTTSSNIASSLPFPGVAPFGAPLNPYQSNPIPTNYSQSYQPANQYTGVNVQNSFLKETNRVQNSEMVNTTGMGGLPPPKQFSQPQQFPTTNYAAQPQIPPQQSYNLPPAYSASNYSLPPSQQSGYSQQPFQYNQQGNVPNPYQQVNYGMPPPGNNYMGQPSIGQQQQNQFQGNYPANNPSYPTNNPSYPANNPSVPARPRKDLLD